MPFHANASPGLVSSLVTLLVASVFVYLAARIVLDRASFLAAIATAIVGTLLSGLAIAFVPGLLGILLGMALWSLVAAVFFRTHWLRGAVIGLVAAVLWVLVQWVVDALT